jgi:hypothetical protein
MLKFDADKKKSYQKFVRMMYKATTKVSFAMVKDPKEDIIWIVGYYCYKKPKTETGDRDDIKKNVGRYCIVDGYNDCYNQRALSRHNERR